MHNSHSISSNPQVLLVSDNRDNPNWGSRSSTMALLDLLAGADLAPAERVMDSQVRSRVPVLRWGALDALLRAPAASRLAAMGLRRGGRTSVLLNRTLGLRDASSDDPADTVARWRRARRAPLTDLVAKVQRADALVVNGEGSMIFTTPSRVEQRFHLAAMQLARESGIPFAYVNALVADPPGGPRNQQMLDATLDVLGDAALVATRDPESLRFLRSLSTQVRATYVPDAVFSWRGAPALADAAAALASPAPLRPFVAQPELLGRWDFTAPYICVGGSSRAAKDPERAAAAYRGLLEGVRSLGLSVVVTVTCLGDAFLEGVAHDLGLPVIPAPTNVYAAAAILGRAEITVTGRYHPAILAGLGGAPCVLLGADSHKTRSVQEVLGYPEIRVFSAFPDGSEVEAIVETARGVLERRATWSEAIRTAVACRAEEAAKLGAQLRSAFAGAAGR